MTPTELRLSLVMMMPWITPLSRPAPTPSSRPSQGLVAPVITAMQPASPTIPATERSNSRIRIDRPSPSATRPKVANSCMTLKIVPTLKKKPVPRSISASTTIDPTMTVNGRAAGLEQRNERIIAAPRWCAA